MERVSYSLKELCRAADVTERTVRYYIAEGLLPPPSGTGPFSRYGYEHWLRLQFIRRLKDEYLPLSEIKNLLADKPLNQLENIARRTGLITGVAEAGADGDAQDSYLESLLEPGRDQALQFLRQQMRTTDSELSDKGEQKSEPTEPSPAPKPVEYGEEASKAREGGTGKLVVREEFSPPPAPPSYYAAPAMPSYAPPPSGAAPANFAAPPPMPMGAPPAPASAPRQRGLFKASYSPAESFAAPAAAQPQPPAFEPNEPEEVSGQSWERITVAPGIELHVESSIANRHRPALNLLIREVRRLFGK